MRTRHKAALFLGSGLLALLAGCNNGGSTTTSPSESASPTDSASASATADSGSDSSADAGSGTTTTVTQAPETVTQAPVTTTVTPSPARGDSRRHLRPMNTNERQMYQRCEHDAHQSGCDQYTVQALRNRGIDPNS